MSYKAKYTEYLKSNHWRSFRKKVLSFWNNECSLCGAPATEAHHRNYNSLGKEKITDCIALCRNCHERHHNPLKQMRIEKDLQLKTFNNKLEWAYKALDTLKERPNAQPEEADMLKNYITHYEADRDLVLKEIEKLSRTGRTGLLLDI